MFKLGVLHTTRHSQSLGPPSRGFPRLCVPALMPALGAAPCPSVMGDLGLSFVKLAKYEEEEGAKCGQYTELGEAVRCRRRPCAAP